MIAIYSLTIYDKSPVYNSKKSYEYVDPSPYKFVHLWQNLFIMFCVKTGSRSFNYNISIFWHRRTFKKGRYILRSLLNIYFRIIERLNHWKSHIFRAVPSPKIQIWIIYIRYLHLRRTMPLSRRQISFIPFLLQI